METELPISFLEQTLNGYLIGTITGTLFGLGDHYFNMHVLKDLKPLESIGIAAGFSYINNGIEGMRGEVNYQDDMGKTLGYLTGYSIAGKIINLVDRNRSDR